MPTPFGLVLAGYVVSGAALLSAAEGDDPRAPEAVERVLASGRPLCCFQADTPAGQHALRVIGRVR